MNNTLLSQSDFGIYSAYQQPVGLSFEIPAGNRIYTTFSGFYLWNNDDIFLVHDYLEVSYRTAYASISARRYSDSQKAIYGFYRGGYMRATINSMKKLDVDDLSVTQKEELSESDHTLYSRKTKTSLGYLIGYKTNPAKGASLDFSFGIGGSLPFMYRKYTRTWHNSYRDNYGGDTFIAYLNHLDLVLSVKLGFPLSDNQSTSGKDGF